VCLRIRLRKIPSQRPQLICFDGHIVLHLKYSPLPCKRGPSIKIVALCPEQGRDMEMCNNT
jgi:hypothetical protein